MNKLHNILSTLTLDDDGSLRTKLIMKVKTDENNKDLILIPDDISGKYNKLKHTKD